MAAFSYVAIEANGKEKKGSIEAESVERAQDELRAEGLIPLKVTEQNLMNKDINIDIGGKPTPRDLSVFCRQFASMIKSGVSVREVLMLLSEQTENKKLLKAVISVRTDVEKGESLAESMRKFEDMFTPMLIETVAAGETSGNFEETFDRMATQFEKSSKIQGLVKKAMIYPIVIAFVAVLVIIVMLVVVIPSYTSMFADLGTELPALTKAVVKMSDFVIAYWYLLIAGIAVAVVIWKAFAKSTAGKYALATVALRMPGLGNLQKKQACSLLARNIATMMGSGVPIIEAIEMTAKTMPNILYRDAMGQIKESVSIGVPLSSAIEQSALFPPMVYHMVRIGEEAGTTDEMLEKLADYYDEEVEMAVQSAIALMEPMIILVMAGIVCVLIGAVMAPMLTMYTALDSM